MTIARASACLVCGGTARVALPAPGACAMRSDWRVLRSPLRAGACATCGLVVRPPLRGSAASDAEGYALNAHAPGLRFERARAEAYASWIAGAVRGRPRRVLDVGCGNGSLLLALRERWPESEYCGCDPSAESVARGRTPGLRLWQGAAEQLPDGLGADLALAVNVIEHTADPVAFLRHLRRAVARDGTVVVICPDGGRPGVELLFADHRYSLAAPHLRALFSRAGLAPTGVEPETLGEFQIVAGRPGPGAPTTTMPDPGTLNAARAACLRRWAALDSRLSARLPPRVVCFGVGEAAGLLRAYAPGSWERVTACTADERPRQRFGRLRVVPLDTLPRETALLVGVRAADQPAVAAGCARGSPR